MCFFLFVLFFVVQSFYFFFFFFSSRRRHTRCSRDWSSDVCSSDLEFLQQIRILVIDCFHGDVDPASRHGPIRAAKCGTTFWRFGLHGWLFGLAMQCAPPQKRIVFFLLQPVRRARTFLVTTRHITRRRCPKRLGLRAFESDNLLRHRTLLLRLRWSSFFLL